MDSTLPFVAHTHTHTQLYMIPMVRSGILSPEDPAKLLFTYEEEEERKEKERERKRSKHEREVSMAQGCIQNLSL